MGNEIYLGDGLYASFDGWQFILRAPREFTDHWVGLDFTMLDHLNQFAQEVRMANVPSTSSISGSEK